MLFDEPTALLENDEGRHPVQLHQGIEGRRESSIIYISHRLEEIIDICDSVTVLKDGAYVDTRSVSEVTKDYSDFADESAERCRTFTTSGI